MAAVTRSRMIPIIEENFHKELQLWKDAWVQEDYSEAWYRLERAHILSQAYAWPHVKVHLLMLVFAVKRGDFKEVFGQLVRIVVAAPGSWLGRAPKGNTGGANVGIFQPMSIPKDLEEILLKAKQ